MTRRSCCVAMALVMLAAAGAEAKPRKFSWEISPFIGDRHYDDSLGGLNRHAVYGVRLGYNLTRHWEIEAGWDLDPHNSGTTWFREGTNFQNTDVGVVLNLNTGVDKHQSYGRWISGDRWIPYLTAGVGYFTGTTNPAKYDAITYFVGGGTRLMVSDIVGVRFDVRNMGSLDTRDFPESFSNLQASVGASFIVGGGVPRDSDSDGVIDGYDKCPGTPLGCWVDEQGCPRDSDGDGVCDGLDRCPGTPAGCMVDQFGCPLDADGDGVCDGLDDCPGTPAGSWVDERGCPRDSDNDGVNDGLDKCPDTPAGCKVDAQGCPLDSDGDGVCDGIDECPDTPAGTKVDAKGCPIEVAKLVLADVHFEFNKSAVLPFYKAILDEVAKSLLANDWRSVEIELRGHTDAIASVDYNYRLGQARADSVKEHLVSRGVAPARIVTKSYSELQPIAPNTNPDGSDNPAGRAMNRRVEMAPTPTVEATRLAEVKILTRDVMFAAGSSDLTDEGRRYLDELARTFSSQELADLRLRVGGGGGTGATGAKLAKARADAVVDYLTSHGIAKDRVSVSVESTRGERATIVPEGAGAP